MAGTTSYTLFRLSIVRWLFFYVVATVLLLGTVIGLR
jgi:hypothetical protein